MRTILAVLGYAVALFAVPSCAFDDSDWCPDGGASEASEADAGVRKGEPGPPPPCPPP